MGNQTQETWPFWTVVTAAHGRQFVYAKGEAAARARAESKYGEVRDIKTLPYPSGKDEGCETPDFCYTPATCAGNTSCPNRLRSCVE